MTDKKEETKNSLAESPNEAVKAAEAPPERVTATYRGPHDVLVLGDGSVLLAHVATEAAPAVVEAARAAGHLVE